MTQQMRGMNVTWLVGFLFCVAALAPGEGSALRAGDQIVQCAKTKVKVHDQCVDEASLCQAVENFSLALTCSPCNDTVTVDWFFSPVSQKEVQLSQHNKTLFLAAVNVTKEKVSGCYMCQCGSSEVKNEMHFSVQVGLPVPPTFLVETEEDGSPTNFDLIPSSRSIPLVETSPGVVCINCSATGYPNLQYRWSYQEYGGEWKNASSDPCLRFHNNRPEVLCFTPTVHNVRLQRTYRCEVSNIVQTVTAQQIITYPGFADASDWFVRPHEWQSRVEIPLIDGTATAICAAYRQTEPLVQVQYYVCALPHTADASMSACLFSSLTCCSCGDDSCPLGINVTRDEFVDSVGIRTVGCRVDSAMEGNFVCLVEKNVSTDSAKQFIGNFSFRPETSTSLTLSPWEIGLVSAGVLLGTILALVPILLRTVFAVRRHIRHNRDAVDELRRRQVYDEEEEEQGERRHLLETNNTDRQPMMAYSTNMARPRDSVKAVANLEEEETVPQRMESSSVLTDSGRHGKALFDQVRKRQSAVIYGLNLDAHLLAKLNERGLLPKTKYSDINAHILRNNIPAAGTYFVNSVVFQWSYEVFEKNVRLLIEALQSHDDSGNQSVARDLRKCFSECKLDFPVADATAT